MALQAVYRYPADERDYTCAAAQKGGDIIDTVDGFAGVILGNGDYASGDVVRVAVKGVFEVACASGTTFSAGDRVMWDISAEAAVTVASSNGDFDLGTAVKAKTSGQTSVWVVFNENADLVDDVT